MITSLLISINAIIFILMVLYGVDPINPTAQSIYNFGGNFGPDILIKGQYWRLITSNYIHIGFTHLLFNMWCLYSIGTELEEFIGSQYFIVIYTISGISGSIASCFFNYNIVGAGASGAIFGISGALLVMAYYISRKFKDENFNYNYTPLVVFIGYNVIFGFLVPGIDNAAHIGGLIIGSILGLVLIIFKELNLK